MAVRLTSPHQGTKQLPRVFGSCVSSVPRASILQLKLTSSSVSTYFPVDDQPPLFQHERGLLVSSHRWIVSMVGLVGPGPWGNTAAAAIMMMLH